MNDLPWAHGGPPLQVRLRCSPEDFVVDEKLGFEAQGEGEHVLLKVRKRNSNTAWVADQLAAFAGVKRLAVGYAGMKDRHAVTTQSFTVQIPGQQGPDWSEFPHPEVQVLSVERHHRKLKLGMLQGNRFELVLRDVAGDAARAEQRLQSIARLGVPNFFGEQRFGIGGSNIERARDMFAGKRMDRKTRGILLSAARSQLFNLVLARRLELGNWNQAMDGEVWCLNGSRSWFIPEAQDESLLQRLASGDIHPSGALWGRGELPSLSSLAELEKRIADEHKELSQGLEAAGLQQDRRALRLLPQDLSWKWLDSDTLKLAFGLPAGCYATVVLRELAVWD